MHFFLEPEDTPPAGCLTPGICDIRIKAVI